MNSEKLTSRWLSAFLVLTILASAIVAPLAVAPVTADGNGNNKGGTIVGGGGSSDAAVKHPSQYNDYGKASGTFESDNMPPVNDKYEDAAKGSVTQFEKLRQTSGSSTFAANKNGVAVGLSFYNVPDNQVYTIGFNHNIPDGQTIKITPVKPTGQPIDNTYTIDSSKGAANIPLSQEERKYIRETGELYVVISGCGLSGASFDVSEMTLVADGSVSKDNGYSESSATSQENIACGYGGGTSGNTAPTDLSALITGQDNDGRYEVGEQLTFEGSASDAEGDSLSYEWTGATSGQGQTVKDTFSSGGSYTVTLSVSDGQLTSSISKDFNVVCTADYSSDTQCPNANNNAPDADITHSDVRGDNDGVMEVDENIRISAQGSDDPEGDSLSYTFTGEGINGEVNSVSSFTREFSSTGEYTVKVTVKDSHGATSTATTTINVVESNDRRPCYPNCGETTNVPSAKIDVTQVSMGENGVKYEISANPSHDNDEGQKSIESYDWDGGVSGSFDTKTVTFAYNSDPTVTLSVKDDEGQTDSKTVMINVPPKPDAACKVTSISALASPSSSSSDPIHLQAGESKTVSYSAKYQTNGECENGEVSISWTHVGMNSNLDLGASSSSGSGSSLTQTYRSSGTATVTFTASGPSNSKSASEDTVIELKQSPVAVINTDFGSTLGLNKAGSFDGSDSYDPDGGDIQGYNWEFTAGPENAEYGVPGSNDASMTRTFGKTGDWTVKLTVSDDEGQSDSTTHSFSVVGGDTKNNKRPNAPPISVTPEEGTGNRILARINVNGQASDPNEAHTLDKLQYQLTCGNGEVRTGKPGSDGQYICYYTEPGNYNIELTVTDPMGVTDISTANAPATEGGWCQTLQFYSCQQANRGSIDMSASDTTVSVGESVSFSVEMTNGELVRVHNKYYWTFGDGSCSDEGKIDLNVDTGETTEGNQGCEKSKSVTHTFDQPGTYTVSVLWEASGVNAWLTRKGLEGTAFTTVTVTKDCGQGKTWSSEYNRCISDTTCETDLDSDKICYTDDDCIDRNNDNRCDGNTYTEYHWNEGVEKTLTKRQKTDPGQGWTKQYAVETNWKFDKWVSKNVANAYQNGYYRTPNHRINGQRTKVVDKDFKYEYQGTETTTKYQIEKKKTISIPKWEGKKKVEKTRTLVQTETKETKTISIPKWEGKKQTTNTYTEYKVKKKTDSADYERQCVDYDRESYCADTDTRYTCTDHDTSSYCVDEESYTFHGETYTYCVDRESYSYCADYDKESYCADTDHRRVCNDHDYVKTDSANYDYYWTRNRPYTGYYSNLEVVDTRTQTETTTKTVTEVQQSQPNYGYSWEIVDQNADTKTKTVWKDSDWIARSSARLLGYAPNTRVDWSTTKTETYTYEKTVTEVQRSQPNYGYSWEIVDQNADTKTKWVDAYYAPRSTAQMIDRYSRGSVQVDWYDTKTSTKQVTKTEVREERGGEGTLLKTIEETKTQYRLEEKSGTVYLWEKTKIVSKSRSTLTRPSISETYAYKTGNGVTGPRRYLITKHTHTCNPPEGDNYRSACSGYGWSGGYGP